MNNKDIAIYTGSEINPDMIRLAINIDQHVYDTEFQGIYKTCISWWNKNPDIYIMVINLNDNQVIGYINAMPLNDDYYYYIKQGETIDINIPANSIEEYKQFNIYKLYISSIAIHPNFHNTKVFNVLYNAFIIHLLKLYERKIYISSVIADAVTDIGEKICNHIGLKYINDSNHKSKIYEGVLIPPNILPITKLSQELINRYNNVIIL